MTQSTEDRPSEEILWAGKSGQRWLANVDRFEGMIRPIGDALFDLAGFKPGETVVDVGCGAGATSLEIATRVGPTGSVLGLDISPDLVNEATRRALERGLHHLRFSLGDAAQAPIPNPPVDCLFSRFGVMFFSDPRAAFSHLRAFLKPGGQLAMAVWAPIQQNPWMAQVRQVIANHFDIPKPLPNAPGPFAFGDPVYFRGILDYAQFTQAQITQWDTNMPIGGPESSPESAATFLLQSLSIAQFGADAPAAVQAAIHAELTDRLKPFNTPHGVHMPASIWLVKAKA